MDGVDNSSSEDDLSTDDDTGDPSAAKKKKAALREADRLALEGIGEEEDDQDVDARSGKVIWLLTVSLRQYPRCAHVVGGGQRAWQHYRGRYIQWTAYGGDNNVAIDVLKAKDHTV